MNQGQIAVTTPRNTQAEYIFPHFLLYYLEPNEFYIYKNAIIPEHTISFLSFGGIPAILHDPFPSLINVNIGLVFLLSF
jgi:hypothetical protein